MKQYLYFPITFFCTALLTACGGSGEDQQTTPVATNLAPVASADNAVSQNNAKVVIDVLSNDSDADGDALSISEITRQPNNGSAELEGNSISYTPNANYIGEDTFSYSVSDGELSANAEITVQSTQNITISGVVIDSPLANAQVIVMVNNQQFETATNADGEYLIEIPLSDFEGYVNITATGSGSQDQVVLSSFLGSLSNLFASAPESRLIDEGANSAVKVTQLTTAQYLMAKFYNLNNVSENSKEFAQLISRENASELIEVAAFIHLIIDYPNYTLEENQSLATFFAPQQHTSPRQLINNYFKAPAYVDIFGRRLDQVSQDFDDAIVASGNQNVLAYSIEELLGQTLAFTIGDIQPGILPNETDLYFFETSENGTYFLANSFIGSIEYPFSWLIVDGKIEITFLQGDGIGSESFPNYSPEEVARFGEEAVVKAAEIDSTVGFPSGQLYIKQLPSNQLISRFGDSLGKTFAVRLLVDKEILQMNDNVQNFFYENPTTIVVSSIGLDSSIAFDSSADAMTGDWLLHFQYGFKPDVDTETYDNVEPRLNVDRVTFNNNGEATADISGLTFSWSANDNGSFQFSRETESYVVTPLFKDEFGYLAKYEHFSNQESVYTFVRKLYKADIIDNFEVSSLTTNYPISFVSLLAAGTQNGFENGLLNPEYVFAYQFNNDNTVDRLRAYDANFDPFYTDTFVFDWQGWKVVQDGLTLRLSDLQRSLHVERTWRIFKTTEDRIWFIRSQFFLRDTDSDGIFDYTFVNSTPVLNSALKTDLSQYNQIWTRTLEQGILNP